MECSAQPNVQGRIPWATQRRKDLLRGAQKGHLWRNGEGKTVSAQGFWGLGEQTWGPENAKHIFAPGQPKK